MVRAQRVVGFLVLMAAFAAEAHERRFTFTYETNTLPQGAREIEVWESPRIGREQFYARFDQRLEFEVGVTDRLMLALYLNSVGIAAPDETGVIRTEHEFDGMSAELKYRLFDPVADPVGFAVYFEALGNPNELELEGKLIFDKRIGNVLLAANLVAERGFAWEQVHQAPAGDLELELDLAGGYFLTNQLSLGLEVRNQNEVLDGNWEHSALFVGPTVAYSEKTWWIAATLLTQTPALKADEGETLILDEAEKFNGRIVFALMF